MCGVLAGAENARFIRRFDRYRDANDHQRYQEECENLAHRRVTHPLLEIVNRRSPVSAPTSTLSGVTAVTSGATGRLGGGGLSWS
jgi:hypothetical protein